MIARFAAAATAGLLLPSLLAAADSPSTDALPSVAPGWKLELIASAPRILHPAFLTCAPDGRIFVAEDPQDMQGPVDKPIGRILCFHPDGHVSVFAENLYAVYGMRYIEGKLYVHHSPKFSVFRDENSTASGREDLIESDNPAPWGPASRGKNQINDHIPSGFEEGMDGFFYISVGDKGVYHAKGRDKSELTMRWGGVMRMRPDGADLQEYCSGLRNCLNVAITSQDEMFVYDNSDHTNLWPTQIGQVVESGYYGYPLDYRTPRPYTLPMLRPYAGGAPTDVVAYDEDALPPEYRDNLFLCDWGRRELLRVVTAPEGGGTKVVKEEKILFDEKGDFRPTGLAISPDGASIYVADWQFGSWREKRAVGRLFKVTWEGENYGAPKPGWYVAAALNHPLDTTAKIVAEGLKHPARSVRMEAQRQLAIYQMEAEAATEAVLKDASAPAYARWHALWTLDAIDGGVAGQALLLRMLQDPDATVRTQALRWCGTRKVASAIPDAERLLKDLDPVVRMHAAAALGRIGELTSIPALQAALTDRDRFARFEAFTALNRIGRMHSDAWPQIVSGLSSDNASIREATGFACRETYEPRLIDTLAAIVADAEKPVAIRESALTLLAPLYKEPTPWDGLHWRAGPVGYTEDSHEIAPFQPKTLTWPGTSAIQAAFVGALRDEKFADVTIGLLPEHPDRAILEMAGRVFHRATAPATKQKALAAVCAEGAGAALVREVLEQGGVDDALLGAAIAAAPTNADPVTPALLLQILGSGNPELRAKAITAYGKLAPKDGSVALMAFASDAAPQVRAALVGAFATIGGAPSVTALVGFLQDADLGVRKAAIAALGAAKSPDTVPGLIAATRQPETRLEAISALTKLPDLRALDAYVDGLAEKNPTLRDSCAKAIGALKPESQKQLAEHLPFARVPATAAEELRKLFGPEFIAQSSDLSPERYDAFAQHHDGVAAHGKEIFSDPNGVGCSRCHTIAGKGGDLGPDLSHIGANYKRAELIESVLYPSKKILGDYVQFALDLKNGDSLFGAIRDETAESLVLVDGEGKKHLLTKGDIVKRVQSELSPMPAGLQGGLSLQDFADVIAYLESLK